MMSEKVLWNCWMRLSFGFWALLLLEKEEKLVSSLHVDVCVEAYTYRLRIIVTRQLVRARKEESD